MSADDNQRSVLDLVKLTASQEGKFTMGSVLFEDKGAYSPPQTIRRHGTVRRAEPPLVHTGHGPTMIAEGHRYKDGRIVNMPGLPSFERTTIHKPDSE